MNKITVKLGLLIGLIVSFLAVQNLVFADEIVDKTGNIIQCRIVTVGDGLIEYEKDGCLNTFYRNIDQPIFNDYVDVRTKMFKRHEVITRYSGTIIIKDYSIVKIRTQNGVMTIPWYRVKFVGVYKPD